MDEVPIVVLAPPGAGGADVAVAVATATGRPIAAWDELSDEAHGDGEVLRTVCRRVLWRFDRDWTCSDGIDVAGISREERLNLCDPLRRLWDRTPPPVLYDPALRSLLPVLDPWVAEVQPVVVVRDPAEALPVLVARTDLAAWVGDDLLRSAHRQLHGLATAHGSVPVVDTTGGGRGAGAGITGLFGGSPTPVVVPTTTRRDSVEADDEILALRDRAQAKTAASEVVSVQQLHRVLAAAGDGALDRWAGPRTAARHQELRALLGTDAPSPVLVCTRATGPGAWVPDPDRVEVVAVDSVARMREVVADPVRSAATVLLPDLTSWATNEEAAAVLSIAADVVTLGGVVAVGRTPADEDERSRLGLPSLSDEAIGELARRAGLEPSLTRRGQHLRAIVATAQRASPSAVGALQDRIRSMAAELEARTAERDRARVRLEALRGRRAVRWALAVVDALVGLRRRWGRRRG